MLKTGVRLTADETAEVLAMARDAGSMPVMLVSTEERRTGIPYATKMWERTYKRINELATAHGLPDLDFYYTVLIDGELAVADGYETSFTDAIERKSTR